MVRVFTFPYGVEQDEDGAWCACAQLRPGVAAFGDGPTREAALADLREGMKLLLEEVGTPDVMSVSIRRPGSGARARRVDYYDDPGAPEANSLVPSVNVVVVNDARQILMIRRSDNGNWAVPGGAVDLGETVAQAGVRETREETGVECEITGLIGLYSDPKHVIFYTSDGEARQEFSIVLTARPVSGRPTPSDESTEARWVHPSEFGDLAMDRSMRVRIRDYLEHNASPVLA